MNVIKSRSRSWVLTIKAENVKQEEIQKKFLSYVYIGQLEKGGKTDYLHYQIYIENPEPIKFDTLKNKFPDCHIEPRRGTRQEAYDYVTKSETKEGEPFGNGEIDLTIKDGKRTDIDEIRDAILVCGLTPREVILEYPQAGKYLKYVDRLYAEKMSAYWSIMEKPELTNKYWWGDTRTGKTTGVFKLHDRADVYRVTNYKNPFDSYNYQSILVLDEYRGQFPPSMLLNILDRQPYEFNCRYNSKWSCHNMVYIISNIPFEKQYEGLSLTEPKTLEALKIRIKEFKHFQKTELIPIAEKEQATLPF